MTRQEAIIACRNGKKVTHQYFGSDEFVEYHDGQFWTEEGYQMGQIWDEFWTIRMGGSWGNSWSIYNN